MQPLLRGPDDSPRASVLTTRKRSTHKKATPWLHPHFRSDFPNPSFVSQTKHHLPSSPPRPQPLPPPKRAKPPTTPLGPLRHPPLRLDALHHPLQPRLDDHAAHNHLVERGVQRLKVEDQIQLAHVLEQAVEGLDEDLDQVEQGERGLGGRADDDEVEGRVVAVGDDGGRVGVGAGGGAGGGGGEEGGETVFFVVSGFCGLRLADQQRGGWGSAYGRKLQDELGRLATRVKISEIRRCWTAVSCGAACQR